MSSVNHFGEVWSVRVHVYDFLYEGMKSLRLNIMCVGLLMFIKSLRSLPPPRQLSTAGYLCPFELLVNKGIRSNVCQTHCTPEY